MQFVVQRLELLAGHLAVQLVGQPVVSLAGRLVGQPVVSLAGPLVGQVCGQFVGQPVVGQPVVGQPVVGRLVGRLVVAPPTGVLRVAPWVVYPSCWVLWLSWPLLLAVLFVVVVRRWRGRLPRRVRTLPMPVFGLCCAAAVVARLLIQPCDIADMCILMVKFVCVYPRATPSQLSRSLL